MEFKEFIDVESLYKEDCEGMLLGTCYVFPKIDGTNASLYFRDGVIRAGSRTRELVPEKDNFDFLTGFTKAKESVYRPFFEANPGLRLCGEYLVPHTLKTYREEAWRDFYIFDVMNEADEYIPYEDYKGLLDAFGLNYIPCIAKIENPSMEQLEKIRDGNTYLIKDGAGAGEGIVIKRYNWRNHFDKRCYGKLVRNEFKEANAKEFFNGKVLQGESQVEIEVAHEYVTDGRIDKILAKMEGDGPFHQKRIPELLSKVYHDIVTEEMWQIIKDHKRPTIDFRKLNTCVIEKVKEKKRTIFG